MTILIVEDDANRREWFVTKLQDKCEYWITKEPVIAITTIESDNPTWIFLDFDLGGEMFSKENSLPVAKFIKSAGSTGHNVIIHSWNPVGVIELENLLPNAFIAPFGSTELKSYIDNILQEANDTTKVPTV